jgi:hypothetical protein
MSHCRSCRSVIDGAKVVVQYHDGANGIYCGRCAGRLVGVSVEIDDARALRKLVASGALVRQRMLVDEDIETVPA